jgi:hypothetical protein
MNISKITNQGSGIMNEDALLIEKKIFGVFDGATSLDKYIDPDGNTGGALASSLAQSAFAKHDKQLKDLALDANAAILKAMQEKNVDITNKHTLWSTGFAVIEITDTHINWLQISDCLVLFIYKDGSFSLPVKDYDHDEENLIKWKSLGDMNQKEKRKALQKDNEINRSQQNITYGFLNGEPEAAQFFQSGSEPIENIAHVLLFTDGFFPPKENPQEPDDFSPLVALFLDKNLEAIIDDIRKKELQDPECITYPRMKPHDDATAVAISF